MNVAEKAPNDFFGRLLEPTVSLLLTRLSNFLTEQNIESYVVGGFIRDVLLKRDTADIDIAVAADALEIAPRVATAFGGKYVLLDRVNRVGRVILANKEAPSTSGQWELDFSTFKGGIKQDLRRRDFTINAMAVKLSPLDKGYTDIQTKGTFNGWNAVLIDPFNGRSDLQEGVIRAVTSTAFEYQYNSCLYHHSL